jgi:hypothetical protein
LAAGVGHRQVYLPQLGTPERANSGPTAKTLSDDVTGYEIQAVRKADAPLAAKVSFSGVPATLNV